MIVTAEQIIAMRPCYPDERVRALVGDGVTPQQIRDADIPPDDRLWVLVRLLDRQGQVRLAAAAAERALMRARVVDQRCWDAIRVARLVAMGEMAREEAVAEWARAAAPARAAAWAAEAAAEATALAAAAARAASVSAWEAVAEWALASAWAALASAWAAEPVAVVEYAALDDAVRLLEEEP